MTLVRAPNYFVLQRPPATLSGWRVIVAYIEARPERMKDGFELPANEPMAKAWPCQKMRTAGSHSA